MARSINLEDVKRGDLLRVYPEDLIVNPEKRGRKFPPSQEDVQALGLDIGTRGQEQPVPVSLTFDRKLELYAGFTRWEGITWWNATHPEQRIRIECVVKDRNDREAFIGNLKENRLRNQTTVVDDAHNIRRLSEQFGMTDEEILALYGKPEKPMSPSWLEGMRAIVRLPDEKQLQLHTGEISKSVALQIAQMDPAERDTVLATAQADGGKVTTTTVLKAARKHGALNGAAALKMPEVKSSFTYLVTDGKNDAIRKLAQGFLDFQANKLPEPDFYALLNRLLA
jgi:hypothetical protein